MAHFAHSHAFALCRANMHLSRANVLPLRAFVAVSRERMMKERVAPLADLSIKKRFASPIYIDQHILARLPILVSNYLFPPFCTSSSSHPRALTNLPGSRL